METAVGRDPGQALPGERGLDRWMEEGPWLLLPLLLIAAGGFRRGWLGVLVLFLVLPPQARAFGWQDLWLRPDQQASRLLDAGEAAAAAERFTNPDWRALARYRAGDYAGAAQEFGGNDPDGDYNRGNALARAGRLQEAKAAYEAALAQRPGDADARFNHDLVTRLLQQQQAQSDSAQQGGSPQDRQQGSASKSSGSDSNASDTGNGQGSTGAQAGGDRNGATSAQPDSTAASADDRKESAEDSATTAAAGQQPKDIPAGRHDSRDQQGATGPEQPRAAAADGDHEQNAGDARGQQATPRPPAQETASGEPPSTAHDSAERARADVTPAAGAGEVDDTGKPARQAAASADRQIAAPDQKDRLSEQDIALEQWLHQVPDDPAGLLRRKFMLEHLLRQQGRQTP